MTLLAILSLTFTLLAEISWAQIDQDIELRQERLPLGRDSKVRGTIEMGHFHFSNRLPLSNAAELNALQLRGRVGLQFWNGQAELFGVVGAIKRTDTQRLIQKRPYMELSFYPSFGSWGQIHQYNIVHLPFSDAGYDEELSNPELQGSVYTVGIAPTGILKNHFNGIGVDLKAGIDVWTRLYSRDQTVTEAQMAPQDRATLLEEGPIIEDKSTLFGAIMMGITVYPAYLRRASIAVTGYLVNRQTPFYQIVDDDLGSQYKVMKSSFYLVKGKYALNGSWVLSNESYIFYRDYFREKVDKIGRSFRNIVRLTYHL